MMTPQLFINYKLKSVAHLPWRMLTYKALNTFIDDLFAFVIRMPLLYRLGCFRDGERRGLSAELIGKIGITAFLEINQIHIFPILESPGIFEKQDSAKFKDGICSTGRTGKYLFDLPIFIGNFYYACPILYFFV